MPLIVECFACGALNNNVFLVIESVTNECALFDPTMDSEYLASHIESKGSGLKYIVNTHGHFDHTFNNKYFKTRFPDAELLIHEADKHMLKAQSEMATMFGFSASESPEPDRYLDDGDTLTLGSEALMVLGTPGHTIGGLCFYNDGFVIAGDTLFKGGIGRTDLQGGDHRALLKSIAARLYTLPDETVVYCGHGPSTTIGNEKKSNPFTRLK